VRNPDGLYEPIEVKGATEKIGATHTCNFKSVSTVPGKWTHLILIGRKRDVVDAGPWDSIEKIEPYLTLGYIHWDDFARVLAEKQGPHSQLLDLCLTPGSSKSQFGGIVKWTDGGLRGLTPEWWQKTVMPLPM
jgi:hypothetical protein